MEIIKFNWKKLKTIENNKKYKYKCRILEATDDYEMYLCKKYRYNIIPPDIDFDIHLNDIIHWYDIDLDVFCGESKIIVVKFDENYNYNILNFEESKDFYESILLQNKLLRGD